jgi:ABC-type multidrug transport system permease subunit
MTATARAKPASYYARMTLRQLYYEQLNFWLNPLAAGFTVGFSVVFLVLLASSAGHSTSSTLGGVRVIQYYVPGFIAYGVMSTCFNSLATSLVVRRETGLLKRLRLSPLPTPVMFAALCANAVVICFLQVVVLLLIGRFGYRVHLPHNLGALAVALVVGVVCFTAIGIAVSTLVPNQEAAGPIISIVFFVLLFLSGLWYPIDPHSGLSRVASFFPIRPMIQAVYAPFDPRRGISGWAWGQLGTLVIWGAVSVFVALRRWSWAPRRTGDGPHRRAALRPGRVQPQT